uniref:Uncharacterized protein n=1 Tax=Branchiostoma floridae TaxID=7739 RepID=C3YAS7_BRAFL|eukprot:XP_002606815.1 hypothetical protein BRAFLDRAFT_82456 [Branchiostoma floridae]
MLEPSSSEEESEPEVVENTEVLSIPDGGSGYGGSQQSGIGSRRDVSPGSDNSLAAGSSSRSESIRPSSPSPSIVSEKEKEDLEKLREEEEERKRRLQLYVFVLRCIAYPFNAKQPTDMARRQAKVTKQQLQTIKERFGSFISGDTQIVADEAFCNAVQSYYEVFLKSDRVTRMVASGGCSSHDFREVFKNNIEKRRRLSSELILSKEQLYEMFQQILGVKKFEHQLLYNACQNSAILLVSYRNVSSELILSKEQLYEMFQQILGVKKFEHQLLYNACQLTVLSYPLKNLLRYSVQFFSACAALLGRSQFQAAPAEINSGLIDIPPVRRTRFGSLCCYGNRQFGRPARAEPYQFETFERPVPGRRPKAFEPCRPGPVPDVVRTSPSGQSGPFLAVRAVLRTVERPSGPTNPSDPRTIAWFELTVHARSD